MPQKLVSLRQMQSGLGVLTALSLGMPVPGLADAPAETQTKASVKVAAPTKVAALVEVAAPAKATAPANVTAPVKITAWLGAARIEEASERTYDAALGAHWSEANRDLAAIERAGAQLPADGRRLRERFGLFRAIHQLRAAAAARDE